ncbi:MAG: LppX_LprAFG lipoprotein [Ktedonobacteraceae bacterium]
MQRIYKRNMLLAASLVLVLILAACSAPGTTSSLTPVQTLLNSANAMNKLQSVHVDLQAMLQMPASSSTPSANSGGIPFNVTGHGDAASPDQASMNLALNNKPIVNVISKGQTVYVQTANGKWFSVDKSKLKNGAQSFFSQSLASRLAAFTADLQNAKLTDLGQETVNGVSLDHITAVLDQQGLQTLSSQLNGLLPVAQQKGQNQITKATLDLWVDQTTSYIHQAKLDIMAQTDISKMLQDSASNGTPTTTGSTPMVVTVEVNVQLNFSKFNQPVNIEAPANAVPLQQ